MTEFIVKAHAAPIDPAIFLKSVGGEARIEYLAQIVMGALFVSKGHRSDVTLTLVLEKSRDYSRAVSLSGESLGSIGGQHESALLELIADALFEGAELGKEESCTTSAGVRVSATSFEHLAKDRLARGAVFLLDRKGPDLRDAFVPDDPVFLMSDHVPMPKKLSKSLVRQGALPISLGPTMLHASQCVVIAQNEIDRRRSPG